MVIIALAIERLNIIAKALELDNYTRAEAETHVLTDLVKSLKITIRRIERL